MNSGGFKAGPLGVEDVAAHLQATVEDPQFTEAEARKVAEALDEQDGEKDDWVAADFSGKFLFNTVASTLRSLNVFNSNLIEQVYQCLTPHLVEEGSPSEFEIKPEVLADHLSACINEYQPWWKTSFGSEWKAEDFLPVAREIVRHKIKPDEAMTASIQARFPDLKVEIIRQAVRDIAYLYPQTEPLPVQQTEELKIVRADFSSLIRTIRDAESVIGAYLNNPQSIRAVSRDLDEFYRALGHARGILDGIQRLREVLTRFNAALDLSEPEARGAARTIGEMSRGLKATLDDYMLHIRNNIAHDRGRDFMSGIRSCCDAVSARVSLESQKLGLSKAVSAVPQAASSARNGIPTRVPRLVKTWSRASDTRAVTFFRNISNSHPYAKPAIVAASALAAGAAIYWLVADDE